MASRPHPDWTDPQKRVFRDINEARDEVIPYFGQEIPRLDNLTPEMLCDKLGVVKAARKAIDKVEKILAERFKPLIETELRATRYIATKKLSERTALNQGKVGMLLGAADAAGLDLYKLFQALEQGQFVIPDGLELEGETSNEDSYFSTSDVETLNVKPI